jgi:hypothetical protein
MTNKVLLSQKRKKNPSEEWWYMPIIPAILEAEMGGLQV